MKILSFDTSRNKKDMLTAFLRAKLVIVDEAAESDEALDLIRFYEYDVILLRLAEERAADIDIVRKLRLARVRAPIVALSRVMSETTRLRVLQAGADDLIVDPLSHEEVFIKVQNMVRRSRGFMDNCIRIGAVEINMNAKKIFAKGQPVTLTKKEYQIAEILALRKGVVLSKEAILDHLYGGLDEPNPKIIDVFICKIRKKLMALGVNDFIETNWGRGYMVIDHRRDAAPANAPAGELAQAVA